MLKLGSHVSFSSPKYLIGAIEESLANDANAMMIYLGAPQNTLRASVDKYGLDEYKNQFASQIAPEDIVVHAPYIINPASIENFQFAIDLLVADSQRMNAIGAKYMVVHPGASTKFSKEESLEKLIFTIKEVISKTEDTVFLLETMAGKGSELCTTFEEMSFVMQRVNSARVGVCLDTCHIWEAGYDIVNNLPGVMEQIEALNLLEKIKVLHINDSKNLCGAHKDRHENIGLGHIGKQAIGVIVHHKSFENVIKILETPYVNDKSIYKQEIALLKAMAPK